MTGLWVCTGLFILLVLVWAWDKYVTPRRATRPPVTLIMDLIREKKILDVYDNLSSDDRKRCQLAEYVILDTERRAKTFLYWDSFHECAIVEGDLDWMNQHEKNRVYKVAHAVQRERWRKWNEANRIEKEARDKKRREQAKKFYESR